MKVPLKRYGRLLITYLRPQAGSVLLLFLLLAASIGLQLANPQVVRFFIDTTQQGGAGRILVLAAVLFVGIALVQRAAALGTVYVGTNVGWAATNALRADLIRHLLRLDMPFHKAHTPGELIERVDGDVTALANFFSQLTIRVVGDGLLVLGVLLLLFREDWRVGVALGLYTIVTFVALGTLQRLAVDRWAATRQAEAEHYGFLEERISGTEDIRASGADAYIMRRLYGLMRAMFEREWSARLLSNLTFVSTNFLFVIGYAAGLSLGAYLYTRGAVTIGTAYLVVYYIGMLSAPLESIREQVEDLQRATASIDRVEELLNTPQQVREQVRDRLPGGVLGVSFDHVTFAYKDGEEASGTPPVLRDISFSLRPGEVLGVLGRTGSGKTTLGRLLFRLYEPATGVIRVGGVDIRHVAFDDLRARIGMVTQDVQLFGTSVRDNLTLFNRAIDDARIRVVLQAVGMWTWIEGLPRGLDTPIGAGGQGLSAGEAQLLAFGRVFLRDPGLVLLDEASSRLDPATERLLERAVDQLLAERTGIIIAHRLHTVQRADTIMILENGRVVEYGPRVLLAADPNSRLSALLRTGMEELVA